MLVGRPQKRSVFRTCTASARPSSARWAPSPRERGEGKTMPRSRMVFAVPDKFSMPSNQIRRLSRRSSEMTKKPSPTTKQKGALSEKFSLCTQLISELTKKFSPAAELKAEMTEKISPAAELKTEMTKKVSSTPNHNGACARLSGETTRLIASMANQQGAPSEKVSLQTKPFFFAAGEIFLDDPACLVTGRPGHASRSDGSAGKAPDILRTPMSSGVIPPRRALRDMTTGRISP